MRILLWLLILGWTGDVFSQSEEEKPSVYEQGMEIIKREGVDAGIQFFGEHAIETGSHGSLFGMAWGYWVDGKLAEADKICNFILQKKPRPILEAHCHYLQGHIAIVLDDSEKANVNFILALTLYKKLGRQDDIFETYSGLAAAKILDKKYVAAEEYLHQAQIANEEVSKNLGHFYHLKARAAFGQGHFQRALGFSEESYGEFNADDGIENSVNALTDIGFFLILTGNLKEGLEKTHEANDIIQEQKFTKLSYYNSINLILAYRCSGLDTRNLEKNVNMWIETQKDFFLKSLLDFASNHECP